MVLLKDRFQVPVSAQNRLFFHKLLIFLIVEPSTIDRLKLSAFFFEDFLSVPVDLLLDFSNFWIVFRNSVLGFCFYILSRRTNTIENKKMYRLFYFVTRCNLFEFPFFLPYHKSSSIAVISLYFSSLFYPHYCFSPLIKNVEHFFIIICVTIKFLFQNTFFARLVFYALLLGLLLLFSVV